MISKSYTGNVNIWKITRNLTAKDYSDNCRDEQQSLIVLIDIRILVYNK